MNKEFETVVGLEIHAELKTASKLFCSCSTAFGGEPNTHVCAVCAGFPGALPVMNRAVVELSIRAGLAMLFKDKFYEIIGFKSFYENWLNLYGKNF